MSRCSIAPSAIQDDDGLEIVRVVNARQDLESLFAEEEE
jgi:hypothetical protein